MGFLSILILLPLVGILLMVFLPQNRDSLHRWIALVVSLTQLGLVALMGSLSEMAKVALRIGGWGDHFIFKEQYDWINLSLGSMGQVKIDFELAVDGLGFMLIILTAIILPLAILSSWKIDKSPKAYFMLFMLLNLSTFGLFSAMNFFLFFIFFEFMLLPMFFLIGLWGGERREYAALKFFIYTLLGSVLILLVMAGMLFSFTHPEYGDQTVYTLNFRHLMELDEQGKLANLLPGSVFGIGQEILGGDARLWAFALLFIGFAIKIPVVPVHTWLPDAHVEAPTPISVVLAAILLKIGGYGLVRICWGLFPDGAVYFASWIGLLGLISIVYGALVAMAQKDLKRLVAYSSVSHMGFVLLGLASMEAIGINGAAFQLFTHGLISAMLFLIVGVIYDRVQDRQIDHFQGLWGVMPRYAFFVLIAFFASLGLPGLCAFVSEIMVFMGAFQSESVSGALPRWMAIAATLGVVLSAVYFLRTYRQMFFGEFDPDGTSSWRAKFTPLSVREYLILTPLAVLVVLLGIYPGIILDLMSDDLGNLQSYVLTTGANLLSY